MPVLLGLLDARRACASGDKAARRVYARRRGDERGQGEAAYHLGVLLEGRGDLEGAEAAFRRGDERGSGGPPTTSACCFAHAGTPRVPWRRSSEPRHRTTGRWLKRRELLSARRKLGALRLVEKTPLCSTGPVRRA